MDQAQEKSVNVFEDEGFRNYLISKYSLPEGSKVFCASLDAYYGLDADFLIEELGDGDGGLGWAFGFEGAMHAIDGFQEKTRIKLPSGWMAVGVKCGDGQPHRYFLEYVQTFGIRPNGTELLSKLEQIMKAFMNKPSADENIQQTYREHFHDAVNAAFEAGMAYAKETK